MLKRILTAILGIFLMIAFLQSPGKTNAQSNSSARGITIVPPSFELYANPGESLSETLRVRNDSNVAGTYQVTVEDFKAVGEEGQVDLVDGQSNTSYSLAKWVFPEPKQFTLNPQQEKEIPFSINVPKDAEPGGHYASVLVQLGGGSVSSGASVTSRVGSLILLRVSGNVNEAASVESFSADKSYYPDNNGVNFDLRVKDSGNNHIRPQGTIVITNLFGQKVAEITLNGLNVLPGAIRKMDTSWQPKGFLANRYTATLVATYGQQKLPLSASTSFIIFPKWFAIVILAVILLIVLLVLGRKKIKLAIHNVTK